MWTHEKRRKYPLKILFVGSNPSQRSSEVIPFWNDTGSSRVLQNWISIIFQNFENLTPIYCNVVNCATANNRPLKTSEIKAGLDSLKGFIDNEQPYRIVALGKAAEKALTLLRLDFYSMPHPSGRNRKLNDKEYVSEKLEGLIRYVEEET